MDALTIFKILVLISALSIGSAAYSDVVTDWNAAALNVIRANRTPPPIASRALAILHASIYDAVNGITWGESVAGQILALRVGDRSDAMIAPPAGGGPGFWQPTPPQFAGYLLP